jgi:phage terminase small subunit
MPILANSLHEAFALNVAKGMNGARAYREAGGKGKNAKQLAAQLLTNIDLQNRVKEIQGKAEDEAVMSVREILIFLADVKRKAPGEIDESSPLCQEHSITHGENFTSEKIKMPCKLKAVELAAKISGYLNEPAPNTINFYIEFATERMEDENLYKQLHSGNGL